MHRLDAFRFGGVFAAVWCVESGCGSCGVLCGRAGIGAEGGLVRAFRRDGWLYGMLDLVSSAVWIWTRQGSVV